MAVLLKELRDKLEAAVKAARDVAEPGARAALEQLAVDAADPFSHMTAEARELRNRLRARARQLGDRRDARSGKHGIEHIVAECAYEHWHRMLFARFLAENNVLMHPDGVAVTLEECEELAEHEGAADGWEVAAAYAARMLPQIFRPDAPVLQVRFPPEHQRKLEQILADLPSATFTAGDALGWVYQFWQAKRKDEVNRSEVKIGADELPAVTQLFTEPYMVDFLLQNTLGAWWVGRHGPDSLPVEMPYLRFLEDGMPAAGTFDGWPKTAAEITVLDPCCGSGHFLVAAFHILVRFRIAEEGLSAAAACDAVLRDNLHGLEIDERCTQIAAFALALAAWTFDGAGGHRALPEMHIACSGLAPRAKKEDWLALADKDSRVRIGLECLYELFSEAPMLGSLIDPSSVVSDLISAGFAEVRPLMERALATEVAASNFERHELVVAAHGIVTAAEMLSAKYVLVATNPPYRTRGDLEERLRTFCDKQHADARWDIGTVFLSRMLLYLRSAGTIAAVLPQNWTFLKNYHKLRKRFLQHHRWDLLAKIGEGGFESTQAAGAFTALLVLSRPTVRNHTFRAIDAAEPRTAPAKADLLRGAPLVSIGQSATLKNPDARIVLEALGDGSLLALHAIAPQGIKTGDDPRYRRFFWELDCISDPWRRLQSTVRTRCYSGGLESIVDWSNDGYHLARRQGLEAFGKRGVAVSQMRGLPCSLYFGDAFDSNVAPIVPKEARQLPAVWAFVSSDEYHDAVRQLDQKINVTNATLVKVPFDLERWERVATEQYPEGLPNPRSSDPSQWIFEGTIDQSAHPLQVAVARLLGYRWPEQIDDGLDDLIDEDGIVCIPPVRGEESAADRLQALLARAHGDDWSTQKREELLRQVGCAGKGLDHWLREKFFEQHAKLFHHRPFIWHIWDGLKRDGFAALVNCHKLERKLLETLAYNYLGDWIKRQEDGVRGGVDGAEERLQAARELQKKLEMILRGEPPYDIFLRWKPLHDQPMGWEPDLNDGVRINIRPFMTAGVLRHSKHPKLNIKWTKDRGKDPEDAPWYHLGPEYGGKEGDRINEHHLTLEEKRKAREEQGVRV